MLRSGYLTLNKHIQYQIVLKWLDPSERHPIGNIGYLNQPMPVEEFKTFVSEKLKFDVTHLPADKTMIEKVGFCTGGAQDYIVKAAEQGCDAYISGEVSERTFYEAKELGVHYFACGHHATERGGVQRLGQAIADQFTISVQFVDTANPI